MNKLVLFNETIHTENFTYGTYVEKQPKILMYDFFVEDDVPYEYNIKESLLPDVSCDILSILDVSEITLLNDSQNLADSINVKINADKNMFWRLSEKNIDSRKKDISQITLEKSSNFISNIKSYFMLNELI